MNLVTETRLWTKTEWPARPFVGRAVVADQILARVVQAIVLIAFLRGSVTAEPIHFNRDIRPILADNCFSCHGLDSVAREADLRLDQRDAAIEQGAIDPGNPDDSELIARLITDDDDLRMPPPDTKKELTDDQRELLSRWIAAGAEYETHWAFIPPKMPDLPELDDVSWAKNEIDLFVLARLREDGLTPAAEAEPHRLFRRLHLDITGLPPRPLDVAAFVRDFASGGDQALSTWIDRLMGDPTWGEHRARYWLDAARYGDTHGMHFDNYREMWPYRDWVIRAFNKNQPFDAFTVEQLAGDLLRYPSTDQLVATGFQRCAMSTNEGGTIDEENLALYAADRVQTFGWVYLGLTTNCCQCHDHKFDPLTMKDYYSLAAYFRNTTQPPKDGNSKDGRGPVIRVPAPADQLRWDELADEIATAEIARDDRKHEARGDFEAWLESTTPASVRSGLPTDGRQQPTKPDTNTLTTTAEIRTETPLRIGQRNASAEFEGGSVQDSQLFDQVVGENDVSKLPTMEPLARLLEKPADQRSAAEADELFQYFLENRDEEFQRRQATLAKLTSERDAIEARSPISHIQNERTDRPAMANILMRGEYDNLGEEVNATTPAALHPIAIEAPPNRLGLAQWVVDLNNPLTARVTVNRFWQELFGYGIVTTSEDFGVMGAPPTHPELLDWLAVDFATNGWDVKRFFKQVLMSATYRQAATITPEKRAKDPDNRLCSRGPRFRMDAEMVRDYALAASGLLSSKMYGPSVRPYQPSDIWNMVGLPGGDTRTYEQDHGEDLYRRSLYTFWKRMAPPPSLEAFNAPNREVCTVRRERTNTPLQALVTLNDPQFVEAARNLAEIAIRQSDSRPRLRGEDDRGDVQTLDVIARRVLCRPLTGPETEIVLATYTDLLKHYQAHPDDAEQLVTLGESLVDTTVDHVKLAAWTMIGNQILNLDEAMNK